MTSFRKPFLQVSLLVLLATVTCGCNTGQKLKRRKGDLIYSPVSQKTEHLSLDLDLSAIIKKQELIAELRLNNTGPKSIIITEITVCAEGGLTSFPATGNIKPVILPPGRDTVLTVKFNPVNDIKVYELTGRQGRFKPGYKVAVLYKLQGAERIFSANLNTHLPPDDYSAYANKDTTPFIGYSFNTATNFADTESDYLGKLTLKDPVFAFVAHHEIALTGLNIWMTSYCEKDSLYAELLLVNHDVYTIKIIPDSLDFIYQGDNSTRQSKKIVLEKKSGLQQNKAEMEKDDKLLIHFKKPFKSTGKPVIITLKNAFIINGAKALFNTDIELVKVHLP
jgi:hypothetical protein